MIHVGGSESQEGVQARACLAGPDAETGEWIYLQATELEINDDDKTDFRLHITSSDWTPDTSSGVLALAYKQRGYGTNSWIQWSFYIDSNGYLNLYSEDS